MESVVAANGDTLVADLGILGEELVQSHLGLKGDVVEPPPLLRPLPGSVLLHPNFP
jgi:hypothetical protein